MTDIEARLLEATPRFYKARCIVVDSERKFAEIIMPSWTRILLRYENGGVQSTVLMFGYPIGEILLLVTILAFAIAMIAMLFISSRTLSACVGVPMLVVFGHVMQHARVIREVRLKARSVAANAWRS